MGRGEARAGKIRRTQYSDWPHGCADAAFIIAFYSIPPRFNIGRDTQSDSEGKKKLSGCADDVCGPPTETRIREWFLPNWRKERIRLLLTERKALNEERVTLALTLLTGQGGICKRERVGEGGGGGGAERKKRLGDHNRLGKVA